MRQLKEAIDALGLEDASLGASQRKSVDIGGDVARGFVGSPEFAIEDFVEERQAVDLEVEVAEEMGFRLHHFYEWSKLICVWPPAGMSIEFIAGASDEGLYAVDDDEIYIDFAQRRQPVALVNEDGEGLLFCLDGDHLEVGQLLQIPERLDLSEVDTPLEQWLEDSSDEWIVDQGRMRLERNDAWEELVGLGHLARLEEVDASEREALVEQLLEGGVIDAKERILRWADEELGDQAARQLAARTVAALEGLVDELEALRGDYEAGRSIDPEVVAPVFERRDDVQSAWYLLRGTDEAEAMLGLLIEEVDELGRELIDDYRLEDVAVTSTQLRRASTCDAGAWWTELVYPEGS